MAWHFSDGDNGIGLTQSDRFMAALRIVSAITADAGELLFRRNLTWQIGQHRRITDAVVGYFHRSDFECDSINAEMDLAPLAAVIGAMLLRLPFAFAQHLDAGAIDQQVQAGRGGHNFNGDAQCLLPPTHGAVVGDGPVQACQLQQT